MARALRRMLACCAVAGLLAAGPAPAAEGDAPISKHQADLVSLQTRPGVRQDFILVQPPAGPPKAAVVLFAGGHGDLHLGSKGVGTKNGNFLVRSRYLFADAGLLVAVPDTPSDQSNGYGKLFRSSDEHATDIAAVIAYLRAKAPVPVWLVGTSLGTLSTVKGGLLAAGGPDGIVLTSSVTKSSGDSPMNVLNFSLGKIRVPTFIVAHREDACFVSPAKGAQEIAERLTAAPKVEVKIFEGGSTPQGDPCEPFARHGYIGIEPEVVAAIVAWIEAAAAH